MKKIVLISLTLILLFSINVEAQHRSRRTRSALVLRTWDNAIIEVTFDRRIFAQNSDRFVLDDIYSGQHDLVIRRVTRNAGRHGRRTRVIYRGIIDIPRNSKVRAKINRYNELVITRVTPLYDDGGGHGHNHKPMVNMQRLRRSIMNASFESDKQRIAEQAVMHNRVRANNIFQIMNMFSFESSKLSFAKFAYQYCDDINNYYIVNDAFTFNSSIRELDNYIRNHSRQNNPNRGDGGW